MNETNPYHAPSSNIELEPIQGDFVVQSPRSVPATNGFAWIGKAFHYFKQSPGAWILTIIVYFLISIGLSVIPFASIVLYFISAVWTGGMLMGCKAQFDGQPFEVRYLFAGFKEKLGPLLGLGTFMTLLNLAAMGIAFGSIALRLNGTDDSTMLNDAQRYYGWGNIPLHTHLSSTHNTLVDAWMVCSGTHLPE